MELGATGAADPDTLTAGRAYSDNGKGFPSFNRGHEKRAPVSGAGSFIKVSFERD